MKGQKARKREGGGRQTPMQTERLSWRTSADAAGRTEASGS